MTNEKTSIGKVENNKYEGDAEISIIQNKSLSLQMSVGEYMKSLTKESREQLRSMISNNEISFKCK